MFTDSIFQKVLVCSFVRDFRVEIKNLKRLSRLRECDQELRLLVSADSAVCLVWFDLISREITQRRPDDFKSPAKIDQLIGSKIFFPKKLIINIVVRCLASFLINEPIYTSNSCKNYKWSQIWKIATFQ